MPSISHLLMEKKQIFYVGKFAAFFSHCSKKKKNRNRINKREENVCKPQKVWIIYEHEHRSFFHTLFINAMKLFRGVKYPLNWIIGANSSSMDTFRILGHHLKVLLLLEFIDLWHWIESIKKRVEKYSFHSFESVMRKGGTL